MLGGSHLPSMGREINPAVVRERQAHMENPKVILAILAVVLLISILLVLILQGLGPAIVVGDQADPTTDSREVRSGCVVGPVPEGFPFDPFYEKYCDAGGIPIISSGNVSDLALQQAYYIITNMLASIPEVRGELVANGAYFGVIGAHERTTSLPEYAHMNSAYWDQRARGLGGSMENPITTTAEENLLCFPGDRWFGESIAVHEFAHTISLMGMGADFEPLLEEFTGLYESAIQQGLWRNTYAISDIGEYWAEGVQSYFNTNLESDSPDGVHNHVDTREELAEYDPALYAFIARFFNDYQWTPTCQDIHEPMDLSSY
jgi:hypothetical protein